MTDWDQQFSAKHPGGTRLKSTRVMLSNLTTTDVRSRAPLKRIFTDPLDYTSVSSPVDLDRIYHVRLPRLVIRTEKGLPSNHHTDVRMTLDPLSPIAPARVRTLLLPIGRIKKARFSSFVERLRPENVVRLGDISPDGRPNRSMGPS